MEPYEYENFNENLDGTKNIFVGDRMYYGVDENGDQDELECYNSED